MRLILFVLLLTFLSCKVSEPQTGKSSDTDRCQLLMKFASLEDVKRVPYQLSNLKFELQEAVSAEERIYRVELNCFEEKQKDLIQKLGTQPGVEWVRAAAKP